MSSFVLTSKIDILEAGFCDNNQSDADQRGIYPQDKQRITWGVRHKYVW